MFFIFGSNTREVGGFDTDEACPHCEHGKLSFILMRGYVHLFWIPLFPWGRQAFVMCDHCKWLEDTRDLMVEVETAEDAEHNAEMQAIRKEARTPIWYWSGLLIVLAIVLLGVVVEATG